MVYLTFGVLLSSTVAALPGLAQDALLPQGRPDPDRHALRLFWKAGPENLGQVADEIKRRSEASARDAEAECVVLGAECCSNPNGEPFCVGLFTCEDRSCIAAAADTVADEDLSQQEVAASALADAEKAAAEAAAAAAVAAEKARAEAEEKRKETAAMAEEKRTSDAEEAEKTAEAVTAAHDEAERVMSEGADKKASDDQDVKDAMDDVQDAEADRKAAEVERKEQEKERAAEVSAGVETLSPAIAKAHDVAAAAEAAAKAAHDAADTAATDANTERKASMGIDEEDEDEPSQETDGDEVVSEAIKQHDEAVAAQKEAEEATGREEQAENALAEQEGTPQERAMAAAKAAHDTAVARADEAKAKAAEVKAEEEVRKEEKEEENERFLRGDPWPTFAPQHPSGDKHYQSGWTLNSLTALLHRGVASNNLASVGLAIHCFDGTENYFEPWKPCKVSKKDHCPQGGAWWSASIINEKQRYTIGFGGIVLAPNNKLTKVMCSWDSDMGSEAGGCIRPAVHEPFPADKLKDMLDKSMGKAVTAAGRVGMYNEVVIDAAHFERHLPSSIAAFIFFNDTVSDMRTGDTTLADKIVTTNAYLAMIDAYNFTEADVPLLQVDREDGLVLDVSLGARKFAETHTLQQYRESHPKEAKSMPRRYKFDAAPGSKNDNKVAHPKRR